jgi:hypothetical protein
MSTVAPVPVRATTSVRCPSHIGRQPRRPQRSRSGAEPGTGLAFAHLAAVTLAGLVVLRRLGQAEHLSGKA